MPLIPLITAALILVISAPALAQDWIEYSSRADFFSINLPGEPRVRNSTYKSEYAANLPARVYTAEAGPERYTVTVVDFTEIDKIHKEMAAKCKSYGGDGDLCNDRAATDLRGAIIFASWNLIAKASKVTHLVYTQADRVEGHEVHLDNPDNTQTYAAVYMHENRLYILEGTVPKDSLPPLLFQQSMRFLDKDGKSIRYESAYSNGFPPPPRAR